jgi:nitrous oxidase accessory protein
MNDYASIKIIDANNVWLKTITLNMHISQFILPTPDDVQLVRIQYMELQTTEQTSGNGIHLWKCDKMIVKHNTIAGQRDGIYFEFVTFTITGNTV